MLHYLVWISPERVKPCHTSQKGKKKSNDIFHMNFFCLSLNFKVKRSSQTKMFKRNKEQRWDFSLAKSAIKKSKKLSSGFISNSCPLTRLPEHLMIIQKKTVSRKQKYCLHSRPMRLRAVFQLLKVTLNRVKSTIPQKY